MNHFFEITDKKLIAEVLDTAEYGVLALCGEKPYAVPVNFVYFEGAIYFHGSPKGKKMGMLKENNNVSFNVTTDAAIIPSDFSSTSGLACRASTFYKSVIIDGETEIIGDPQVLRQVFSALMEKLQPDGGYHPLESSDYDKMLNAISMVKINIKQLSAKFLIGQHLDQERFQMTIDNLEKRGSETDLQTVKLMKQFHCGHDKESPLDK